MANINLDALGTTQGPSGGVVNLDQLSFEQAGAPGNTLLSEIAAAFTPRVVSAPERAGIVEPFVGVPAALGGAQILEGARLGLAARFPPFVAGEVVGRRIARELLPGQVPADVVASMGIGFEQIPSAEAATPVPFAEPVSQLAGLLTGAGAQGITSRAVSLATRVPVAARAFRAGSEEAFLEGELARVGIRPPGPTEPPILDVARGFEFAASDVVQLQKEADLLIRAGLGIPKPLKDALREARARVVKPEAIARTKGDLPGAADALEEKVVLYNTTRSPSPDVPSVPQPRPGTVRVYRGEGGPTGGAGGDFFTTDPQRAASFGPNVSYIDIPEDVYRAGTAAARQAGSGTPSDAVLPPELLGQARPVPGGVRTPIHDLTPGEAEATPLSQLVKADAPPSVRIAANILEQPLARSVVPEATLIGRAHAAVNAFTGRGNVGKFLRAMRAEQHIVTHDPAATLIYRARDDSERLAAKLSRETVEALNEPWADLPRAVQEKVTDIYWGVRLERGDLSTLALRLEEGLRAEVPDIVQRVTAYRTAQQGLTDELVRIDRLDPKKVEAVYLPLLRGREIVETQLVAVEATPERVFHFTRDLPKGLREFFQHPQRLKGKPTALPITEVNRTLANAYANAVITDTKFLPAITPELARVSVPLRTLVRDGVNEFLGVPGAGGRHISGLEQAVKQIEGVRTLAFNLGASLNNLTQQLFVLSDAGLTNYARGLANFTRSPEAAFVEAKRLSVIQNFTKADVERALEYTDAMGGWAQAGAKATNFSLSIFRGSENLNRVIAFEVGKVAAANKGLVGEAAVSDAFSFMISNQFSLTTRTGILTQFKPYPTNAILKMKTYTFDGLEGVELAMRGFAKGRPDLMQQGLTKMGPFTRYWGYGMGLFGSEAMLPGFAEDFLHDKVLGGHKVTGLLPALFGISFARSVGTGVFPAQDLRDVAFALPGPAVSQTLDAISALTALMEIPNERGGVGFRASLTDAASGRGGEGFQIAWTPAGRLVGPDIADVMSRLTKSLPFAPGIQLDRLRAFITEMKAQPPPGIELPPGTTAVRRPATAREAIGVAPPTGEFVRVERGIEKGKRLIGLRPEEQEVEVRRREKEIAADRAVRETAGAAATLLGQGESGGAEQMFRRVGRLHGELAEIQTRVQAAGGVEAAVQRGLLTQEQRRLLNAPILTKMRRLAEEGERPDAVRMMVDALLGGVAPRR